MDLETQFKSISFARQFLDDSALQDDMEKRDLKKAFNAYVAKVSEVGWLITGYTVKQYKRHDDTYQGGSLQMRGMCKQWDHHCCLKL